MNQAYREELFKLRKAAATEALAASLSHIVELVYLAESSESLTVTRIEAVPSRDAAHRLVFHLAAGIFSEEIFSGLSQSQIIQRLAEGGIYTQSAKCRVAEVSEYIQHYSL